MIDKDTMGLLEGAIKGTSGMLAGRAGGAQDADGGVVYGADNAAGTPFALNMDAGYGGPAEIPQAATSQPSSSTAYAADLYQRPDETFADYIQRMRTTREGGVLGTSSGMMSPVDYTKKAEEEKQKEAIKNLLGNEGSGTQGEGAPNQAIDWNDVTNEQKYNTARFFYDNPNLLSALGGMLGVPLGMLQGGITEYVDEYRNETRTTPSFWGAVFGDGSGDEVLGNRGEGSGSLVTGKATSEADLRAEANKMGTDWLTDYLNETTLEAALRAEQNNLNRATSPTPLVPDMSALYPTKGTTANIVPVSSGYPVSMPNNMFTEQPIVEVVRAPTASDPNRTVTKTTTSSGGTVYTDSSGGRSYGGGGSQGWNPA